MVGQFFSIQCDGILMVGIQFIVGEYEFQLFYQQWKGLVQMVCICIVELVFDIGVVGKVM